MSCFLTVDDQEGVGKISIDDLFQRKQQKDLKQLSIFNKLLNRVHKRITVTGRTKTNEKHIWFTVPEYIFGEPIYDQGDCIGYLVKNLQDNGFDVRYVHPNTLFVSWANFVPSYVRSEIKKKTGKIIDERGNIIDKDGEPDDNDQNFKLMNDKNNTGGQKDKKEFKPINQYKPTGNLVYNPELFEKLDKRVNL
jgi:hypothetical protein